MRGAVANAVHGLTVRDHIVIDSIVDIEGQPGTVSQVRMALFTIASARNMKFRTRVIDGKLKIIRIK